MKKVPALGPVSITQEIVYPCVVRMREFKQLGHIRPNYCREIAAAKFIDGETNFTEEQNRFVENIIRRSSLNKSAY
jgi:hypothetical protein